MMTAQSLALLLWLLIVWWLWVVACSAQAAVADARAGRSEEQRRGVSVFPVFPILPFVAFGVANLIDGYLRPYGSLAIAGLHTIFALVLATSVVRNRALLKQMGTGA